MKEKNPYRRYAKETFLCFAAMICTAAISMAAAGDGVRATGFRPPPYKIKITKAESAKNSAKRLKATSLPASWDSRDKGWVTSVKDQGPLYTCWTFAANAVIETQLLRTGRGEWDLSEKNMTLLCGFDGDWNLGGNNDMAAAYLLRWGGAAQEANDVYFTNDNSYYNEDAARKEWENIRPSHPLVPALHIQNVVWIPNLDETEESRNKLKAAIMEYGAVAVAAMWRGTSQQGCSAYYNGSSGCDHAITVIGWDDNWPTDNFKITPPGNGAWLVKNSHGTNDGTAGGYWYVSYYDTRFGKNEYTKSSVFLLATAEENYTAAYGYDKLGPLWDAKDNGIQSPLQAAVFTSAWNEEVAAVGVWSSIEGNPYSIKIYTNVVRGCASPIEGGAVAWTQSGTLRHAGYTTIPLSVPVPLADRSSFAVVYEQTGNQVSHLMNGDEAGYMTTDHKSGQTWIGDIDGGGITWKDAATAFSACVCLKAYTRTTVPAKAGDAPGETADGTEVLAALAATNALAYAQHGETFGAFANIVGANGRTLWANWLTGLDPANPDDDFTLSIAVTNGVPSLSWTPDLGAARTYTIWGCRDLPPAGDWNVVQKADLATTTNRFFKVTLSR